MKCSYCNKEFDTNNSGKNHERRCKSNPDRIVSGGKTGGNHGNQFTKAKKLGLPKPKISDEHRKKLSDAISKRTDEWNKKNGEKILKTICKKVKEGSWHTSLAKNMHYNYNGVDLHGKWELAYAQYLDNNNIKWSRPIESFKYYYQDTERRYTPDFYLHDTDEYIEVKGYKTEKDVAKWEQFPAHRKLVVLMKEELKSLGVIC